jgi:methylenetetrahydrofolate dehydrogenase(NAD+) / 5,10-methenyltetrahydrofolate cyclohydrolase
LITNFFSIHSQDSTEAKLIDGKKIAEDIRGEIREQIRVWMETENHRAPQLTAVLVGDDPASHTYVKNKMKVSERNLELISFKYSFPNIYF